MTIEDLINKLKEHPNHLIIEFINLEIDEDTFLKRIEREHGKLIFYFGLK